MIAVEYTIEGAHFSMYDEFETPGAAMIALAEHGKRIGKRVSITEFSETVPVILHYEILENDSHEGDYQKEFPSEWAAKKWIRSQQGHPFMDIGKYKFEIIK